MKILSYLNYFFYLGINWNFKIATKLIRQEIKGEKKYGINTTGADELKNLSEQDIDISHATIYMPVSYALLEQIFLQVPPHPKKHFLDIGCGKGRVLCVAASNGYTKITGVDFSAKLCKQAVGNLEKTKLVFPALSFKVITTDAINFDIPPDVDCIFLFNPFDVVVMGATVFNIMESARERPRDILVVYANPVYESLFLEEGFVETFHTKEMQYLEAAILKLSVADIKPA